VGRHLVAALVARGARVTVPTRRRERAKHLFLLPTVEVIEADVGAPGVLARLAAGRDTVVNLAGVLQSRPAEGAERGKSGPHDYGPDFAAAHVELPQALVNACRAAGVGRLLHMSALGADPQGPSEYLRSKGIGERAVLAADDLAATAFRPSVIFGPEDRFLNQFAFLAGLVPVLLVPRPDARFQPVYVGDVVRAMLAALDARDAAGKSYDLCGPREYTLREIVRFACEASGRRRLVLGMPDSIALMQAWTLEHMPAALRLITRDNLRSMSVPSVCERGFPFGLQPALMETAAAAWLSPRAPREEEMRSREREFGRRERFARLRWRARR
jgi:NADH dehydrogenase